MVTLTTSVTLTTKTQVTTAFTATTFKALMTLRVILITNEVVKVVVIRVTGFFALFFNLATTVDKS